MPKSLCLDTIAPTWVRLPVIEIQFRTGTTALFMLTTKLSRIQESVLQSDWMLKMNGGLEDGNQTVIGN